MVWVYSLVSVLVVSLISFAGLLVLAVTVEKLKKIIFFLISFAAGALLGDAFLHILPELIEDKGFSLDISLYLIGAILIFLILERVIRWHHYHHISEEDKHPIGYLNLIGDGFHNFIDGAMIAASYLVDIKLGLATTVAVMLHELPQEIGDFAILLHSGFTKIKALVFNFLSGLIAIVGAILVLWLGSQVKEIIWPLLALTAGGFIYIATVDLIPELHKETHLGKSLMQLAALLLGIGLMLLLVLGE